MKKTKLNNKPAVQERKEEKEEFYFFVKDQGEGAARVVVIVLKVLELIITSIFALCLGIFAPIYVLTDLDITDTISMAAGTWWLVASALYIVGTFVVMLGHSKVASIIHVLAAVCTFVTYYNYMMMFSEIPDNNGPTVLYMPCLFLTVITVVIMLLINLPKWIDKRLQKDRAVAPSIIAESERED